jgi:hypothetical protein
MNGPDVGFRSNHGFKERARKEKLVAKVIWVLWIRNVLEKLVAVWGGRVKSEKAAAMGMG